VDDQNKSRNSAEKNIAQKYFTKTGRDDALSKDVGKKERSANSAKMARLRAMRLAKEADDKKEADKLAAEGTAPSRHRGANGKVAVKPPKMRRLSY